MNDKLKALMTEIEAKGWPRYDVDPVLCMERAREYLDRARKIIARESV
jgi:hypothetical protein